MYVCVYVYSNSILYTSSYIDICVYTNQQNKGLISEDRRNKSTLPLTIPRSLYKSSAKDPVLAAKSEIAIRALGVTGGKLVADPPRSATQILRRTTARASVRSIVARLESARARIIVTLARILA